MKTSMRVSFAGVCVAALLSGCANMRQFHTPDVPVAATYGRGDSAKNAPNEPIHAATTTHPSGDVRDDTWWQQFSDTRLDHLVAKVLDVNTDLAAAGLNLKRARLSLGLATDDLLPHLDVSASTSQDKPLKSGGSWTRSSLATATISYELDLWGKLQAQRNAASWEEQATTEDLESTGLALVGDACNLYWTLGFLNQRVAAGEESLSRLQRTLALVQSQFGAGAVSRLELREAEQNLEGQQAVQSQLIQQRVETRNALTVLLNGEPWPQSDEPQNLNDARSPAVREGIPADLLGRRPDLRAAELRLRKSLTNVDVTRTSYYPAVSLTGTVGGTSTSLGDVLTNPIATLGAGLTLPFLHWNEARLNTAIARTDYEIAAVDFRKTLYTAFTEVDNALSDRVELAKQVDASQKSFDAAADVERLYEVRYRAGATPLRNWLDAQETRRTAELSLAQARLSQLQNDSALFQAMGGSGS